MTRRAAYIPVVHQQIRVTDELTVGDICQERFRVADSPPDPINTMMWTEYCRDNHRLFVDRRGQEFTITYYPPGWPDENEVFITRWRGRIR